MSVRRGYPVPASLLNAVLRQPVRYARSCPPDRHRGVRLVVNIYNIYGSSSREGSPFIFVTLDATPPRAAR